MLETSAAWWRFEGKFTLATKVAFKSATEIAPKIACVNGPFKVSRLKGLCQLFLRPIYTVQLCRIRNGYDKSRTRVVSCKSNLQLACDCRVRHEEECLGLLKHVLKPYGNRSHRQFDIMEIVYDFSMTQAARALKIACDNRKQKSYRVNRPLVTL